MCLNRPALFKGRHFEAGIIVLCVRWRLRFGLSFRNLEELMAERSLTVDYVTIWRWVQRYSPELKRRCRRELRITNLSWLPVRTGKPLDLDPRLRTGATRLVNL